MLTDGGLEGVLKQVIGLLRERRPALLVIDSFKAFGPSLPMTANFAGSSMNLPVTCRLPRSPPFGSVSTTS